MSVAFFVWIFPIGVTIVGLFAIVLALFSEGFRNAQTEVGINPWDETLLTTWQIINNPFGRVVILLFTATVFASEYRHGTWKNLVTRRTRARLIVNKFIVMAAFVTTALVAMTLLMGLWSGVLAGILGVDYGLSEFGERFGTFIREYLLQAFITLAGVFVMAGFGALGAMIGKNIVPSAALGFGFFIFESGGVLLMFGLLQWLLGLDLFWMYMYLPSYNFLNIEQIILFGQEVAFSMGNQSQATHSLGLSLGIVTAWALGTVSLVTYLFHKQDIST